jgi:UDP-glucose 4-epimerase
VEPGALLLLTGATGYLGSAVAAALSASDQGFRYLGRREASVLGADWVPGDLSDIGAVAPDVFKDVSVVIHCAGLAHRAAPERDYDQVNVNASKTLAQLAKNAGVRHFIYLSSLNVVSAGSADPTASSEVISQPAEDYARSKWLAETALREICSNDDMALTVIRPALLFDKTLTANLATLERMLAWWPFLLPETGCRSLVGRPDVVKLILACAEGRAGAPVGQPVIAATDGECYTAQSISRLLAPGRAQKAGAGFAMPLWLCQSACRLLDLWRNASQGSTGSALTARHWCGATPQVIGWAPSLTLKTRLDGQ